MAVTNLKDGDFCKVIGRTHKGKFGFVQDINTSKTGHITITVLQKNGVRFKTLGKKCRSNKGQIKTPYNTGLAKVAVQCFYDSVVCKQTVVHLINICGENRHLRQARNRYTPWSPASNSPNTYKN